MKADVTIVGGGPGGFAAALRAREYGFKTVLIEKEDVGGVCLHRGCIPTKSLIAEALFKKNSFSEMLLKKDKIVSRLHQGAVATLQKGSITLLRGEAEIIAECSVRVNTETVETKFIVVATGSRPKEIPGVAFDGKTILSSDDLLQIKEVPKSLLVVGAGPTGCEFSSLFYLLGSQVTLLEAAPFLLPGQDGEISETLKKIFVKQGMAVCVGEKVTSFHSQEKVVSVTTSSGKTITAEKALISIGRRPNSERLGLEGLKIPLRDGFIPVDGSMRTTIPSIFAVGDVTGQWALAHVASHQGRVAVDTMAGKKRSAEKAAVPECIFTVPEVARVGWTEKEAREKGNETLVGRSSFFVSAKAQMLDEKEGFVKLIGDARTGKLLGAHLLGPHVTELLGELTLALRMGIPIPEIEETIHPHPTLSESIFEAGHDFVQKWKGRGQNTFSNMASKAD